MSLHKGASLRRIFLPAVCACLLSLTILCSPASSYPQTAMGQTTQPNDFQKETIASIREITLQLILIAMGVFAIVGGFAASEDRKFKQKWLLYIAFLLLGASVVFGLLAYGNLIWSLGKGQFEPLGTIEALAAGQWVGFALGGLLFMFAVLSNIRKQ
jgi:cbb3-type cytochrome oxidase maturation FixS-like protein